MRTTDSAEHVYDWYGQRLQPEGWTTYTIGRLDTQLSARGWHRGARESFLVAIDAAAALRDIGRAIPDGGTLFEYSYAID